MLFDSQERGYIPKTSQFLPAEKPLSCGRTGGGEGHRGKTIYFFEHYRLMGDYFTLRAGQSCMDLGVWAMRISSILVPPRTKVYLYLVSGYTTPNWSNNSSDKWLFINLPDPIYYDPPHSKRENFNDKATGIETESLVASSSQFSTLETQANLVHKYKYNTVDTSGLGTYHNYRYPSRQSHSIPNTYQTETKFVRVSNYGWFDISFQVTQFYSHGVTMYTPVSEKFGPNNTRTFTFPEDALYPVIDFFVLGGKSLPPERPAEFPACYELHGGILNPNVSNPPYCYW